MKINESYIVDKYNEGRSATEIAEELHTYPNKILRVLKKNGVMIRSFSESQSNALKTGRHKHPTAGTKRSETTKSKIGESVHKVWDSMSEAEYEKIKQNHKKNWAALGEEKQKELSKKAAAGIREASKHGSKLEKTMLHTLREAGYTVEFHRCDLIQNTDMEIDLWMPNENIAIEIDGPTHYLPIWGDELLDKHTGRDYNKTGQLLAAGYSVIRVKNLVKNISKYKMEAIAKDVLNVIEQAKINRKLYELEVI